MRLSINSSGKGAQKSVGKIYGVENLSISLSNGGNIWLLILLVLSKGVRCTNIKTSRN